MGATLEQWRAKQVTEYKHRELARFYASIKAEWITIDGEGWGRDEAGRQFYRFMVAANERGFQSKVVHTDTDALTMDQALDWLTSIPAQYRQWCKRRKQEWHQPLIGGFALGYDYSHILIDISADSLDELLASSDFDSPPVVVSEKYAVKLVAGNFKVFTATEPHIELISIYDTFKYYQAAFLKVMGAYATPEQWAIIAEGKDRRNADAEHDLATELVYCLNECRVHSRAMNDLSKAVHGMELKPRGWFGPGSLAQSAMVKHKTKTFWKPDIEQPAGLRVASRFAYVGGRFETTGHGWLPRMYGHDIRSAYPASMLSLPCLAHGRWLHITGDAALETMMIPDQIAVGLVHWNCNDPAGGWGPYPVRSIDAAGEINTKAKLPSWPFTGENWIWSEEFRAGLFLTTSVEVKECWVYEKLCNCIPFEWVPDYYSLRYELREAGNEIGEKVVKLILASLYGKIAQSIGKPPVPTWIWAGLITQSARAKLLRAIGTNPGACIMVATDAVYSTEALGLDFGKALGQWDGPTEYGHTLVIQAGFWRDYDSDESDHQKTRGIAKRYLADKWPVFESLWSAILSKAGNIHTAVVPVRYSDHIGLQRAKQYGIEKLGIWTDDAVQNIRFRVDKRPHLIGEPIDGWWKSAPTRTDRVGEQLSLEVTVGEQYISEDNSLMDQYFIIEQPDAAEWGYDD